MTTGLPPLPLSGLFAAPPKPPHCWHPRSGHARGLTGGVPPPSRRRPPRRPRGEVESAAARAGRGGGGGGRRRGDGSRRAARPGIFSRWTNRTRDTRVYSHNGPIGRRTSGH
eukprot:840973-Prorocentrum_minimum.AAC.1